MRQKRCSACVLLGVEPSTRKVEATASAIDELVRERQRLRADGADLEALEQNRRAIVERQQELAAALIERHAPLPHPA